MNDVPPAEVPTGDFPGGPGVVLALEDGRVRLRAITEADLPSLVESGQDPRGTRHWAIELLPHDGHAGLPFAGTVDVRPGPPVWPWTTR